jgi:hypothetical protein
MKANPKLIIGLVAGFWIITGVYNALGCLLLTSAYFANPPHKHELYAGILQFGAALTTAVAASSVVAGIQLFRRKSWARVLLLSYSWAVTFILVFVFIYWLSISYHGGAEHILAGTARTIGVLALPIVMILILRSQMLRSEMRPNKAVKVQNPAAGF